MKRVLIYSTAYYPLVGGAEVAVKELSDRLPDYEFELITARLRPNLAPREQFGRVLVHRFGLGFGGDKILLALLGGFYGMTLHRKNSFDLVWSIMASFGGFAASAFKKGQPEVPYILTLQEGDELKEIEHKVRFLRGSFINIFKRADQIQAISSFLADWAKNLGATGSVVVIPNGVDLKKFNMISGELKEKKEGGGDKIIVSASRLVKKNGLADLILSLKFLPPEVKLWLLGEGEERKYLEKLTNDSGLAGRVKFFGFIPSEQLASYYYQARVFSRPSYSEGLGNAFLEAMACGLPVVATSVGGIKDFLVDGQTGFVCAVGSPENIATRISFILEPQNKEKVDLVIDQAQKMVIEKYDWDKIAPQFDNIFKKLCQIDQ
ncbi:MAG: glycosyltransferase [Candidatus Paceibacterota bacterium]|jgi:glycosyltransferase involved in cell wall biosynthesis